MRRVPGKLDHAKALSKTLSAADAKEIAANSGRKPVEALSHGVLSGVSHTYLNDQGEPVAMTGVLPGGYVWMLVSDQLQSCKMGFVRRLKKDLRKYHRRHPVLQNIVHSENTVHLRLVSWLGFTIGQAVNRYGNKFYHIERRANV